LVCFLSEGEAGRRPIHQARHCRDENSVIERWLEAGGDIAKVLSARQPSGGNGSTAERGPGPIDPGRKAPRLKNSGPDGSRNSQKSVASRCHAPTSIAPAPMVIDDYLVEPLEHLETHSLLHSVHQPLPADAACVTLESLRAGLARPRTTLVRTRLSPTHFAMSFQLDCLC